MESTAKTVPLKGLTSQEVVENRNRFGANLEKERDYSLIQSILKSVFSIFNIVMLIMISIMLLINEQSDAIFMGSVASINTLIELFQQVRAKIIIDRLKKISARKAKVLRESKVSEIPVYEIVIGDVIFLSAGDKTPVDGVVLSSQYVEIDESILTGESDYISKNPGDGIKAGSFAVAGNCYYKVTKLSKDSYIQSVTKEIVHHKGKVSPLQSDINQIIQALTYLAIFFIFLIIGEGIIQEGQKREIFTNSAVLVTSLVPQGLVLITTMSFAYGASKIAKLQAIVEKLTAIEAMATTKVICMDKTGTLTKNAMEVKEISWLKE